MMDRTILIKKNPKAKITDRGFVAVKEERIVDRTKWLLNIKTYSENFVREDDKNAMFTALNHDIPAMVDLAIQSQPKLNETPWIMKTILSGAATGITVIVIMKILEWYNG